jgi:hypothetical protein
MPSSIVHCGSSVAYGVTHAQIAVAQALLEHYTSAEVVSKWAILCGVNAAPTPLNVGVRERQYITGTVAAPQVLHPSVGIFHFAVIILSNSRYGVGAQTTPPDTYVQLYHGVGTAFWGHNQHLVSRMFANNESYHCKLAPHSRLLLTSIISCWCVAGLIIGKMVSVVSTNTLLMVSGSLIALISGISALWSP